MGSASEVDCDDCGQRYTRRIGGGFFFHLLHCDRCGAEKDVSFEDIPEIHAAYLKGSKGPYTVAIAERDAAIRDAYEGEPLTAEEYHAAVEGHSGGCRCGGSFRFDAPARCPRCGSIRATGTVDGINTMYD